MIELDKHSRYALMDELELFQRIKNDDEEAFNLVYYKYAQIIYAFALNYLKDKVSAENTVQHVFLKLWEHRKNVILTVSLRKYLYSIAKNYVLNQLRNEKLALAKNAEIYIQQPHSINNTEEDIENREIQTLLENAIATLPSNKQEIVKLRRNGLSNKEVAEQLNIPENTVKTYYAQSVKILREYFTTALSAFIAFTLNILHFY